MIFNEIYGCYYNAVAKIIELAIDGVLTEKEMTRVAREFAFDESVLNIVPALTKQEWQLIDENMSTPVKVKPTMPLTNLEKRWLKTILQDKRVRLFDLSLSKESCLGGKSGLTEESDIAEELDLAEKSDIAEESDIAEKSDIAEESDIAGDIDLTEASGLTETSGLEGVEPLFSLEDVVYFDKYLDGDDYENPEYINNFRIIIRAIKEHRNVKIEFYSGKGRKCRGVFSPIKVEYSDKEDKFRVLSAGVRDIRIVNMGRIISCQLLDEKFDKNLMLPERKLEKVIFDLTDERNVLERAMMKFAHYKKQVERMEDNKYRVELEYDRDDETDVVIQLMTFGSFVQVLSPETIRMDIAERMKRQLSIFEW